MHAAIIDSAGGGPRFGDFAPPIAAIGERIVEVTASALSQLARARASGAPYSSGDGFPLVPGVDGVGRLEDGRRIYFMLPRAPFGAMAERTVVADGHWFELPAPIDDARAAVIANPGMSSWAALNERAHIHSGDTVLINGATGASGSLAVRIARHLGAAKVIATGRNARVLAQLGADETILISGDAERLDRDLALHFGGGIDIVLDYLWGPSARAILMAAAKAGPGGRPVRFVQIGSISGPEIPIPAPVLRSSTIELMGSGIGSVPFDRLLAAVRAVLTVADEIELNLEYDVVPLRDVREGWLRSGDARTVFAFG